MDGLARIAPFAMNGPCDVYGCGRKAAYIVRHKQGIFGDRHFLLCEECAKSMLSLLPEELAGEKAPLSAADMLLRLAESEEIKAVSEGGNPADERLIGALDAFLACLSKRQPEEEEAQPESAPVPEDKPFRCEVCGKRFGTRNALIGHMSSHRKKPGKGSRR